MTPEYPELATERIRLRGIVQDDLKHIYAGLSHPDVVRYYGVHFDTLESTREQMRWYEEIYLEKTGIWWAMSPVGEHHFFGAIGLNDISHVHRKGEIGFWLLPEHWGNGYVSEAVPAVLDYAYQTLGLHRIEALVEPENTPSTRLLSGLGFTHEGTMRDCEVKDGAFISLEIYARLASDP